MRKQKQLWWKVIDGPKMRRLLVTGRAFSLLSLSSMMFFILLGVAGVIHQQASDSPVHSMKGFAASVPGGFFGEMLEMEMPAFHSSLESDALSSKEIGSFMMRTLTSINTSSPSGLLAAELPGMGSESFLIRKGIGTDTNVGPRDHLPITGPQEEQQEGPEHSDNGQQDETEQEPAETEKPSPTETPQPDKPSTGASKIAFIYHSHNRESWYPEAGEGKADSKTKNITLVGKRLAEKLEENGVGAMHSDTDYPTAIKGYRWELSYKYSKKTVQEAMASSDELKFFFDIHRDSQKRKYTTVDIDGVSYAQVYFIIGHKNPNWKENEEFATKIHDALEKKYPGISRGIWGKTAATGNAEYNQSLASESVLLEVGGVENTLEESYRTADALAEVIADIYWEAEKVSGEE
ncbi:stage II sporulation protein P [Paenibacillus nanensis]|uniref:Stage II sporulation protein P n=1 Tax=Paenibacillus nanensis TaxID=393251 RepID=A0A3A1V406_9BACL|nr:stage II sporulation protein P [Paenibacillus nanensis]RIX54102.1 stage II sporulation protein P [Paenibacillus nanensis]